MKRWVVVNHCVCTKCIVRHRTTFHYTRVGAHAAAMVCGFLGNRTVMRLEDYLMDQITD